MEFYFLARSVGLLIILALVVIVGYIIRTINAGVDASVESVAPRHQAWTRGAVIVLLLSVAGVVAWLGLSGKLDLAAHQPQVDEYGRRIVVRPTNTPGPRTSPTTTPTPDQTILAIADQMIAEAREKWEANDYEGSMNSARIALKFRRMMLGLDDPKVAEVSKMIEGGIGILEKQKPGVTPTPDLRSVSMRRSFYLFGDRVQKILSTADPQGTKATEDPEKFELISGMIMMFIGNARSPADMHAIVVRQFQRWDANTGPPEIYHAVSQQIWNEWIESGLINLEKPEPIEE